MVNATTRTRSSTEQDKAILAIAVPAIFALKGERVIKGESRGFEANAMIGEVLLGLSVMPLEIVILHIYGLAVLGKNVQGPSPRLACPSTSP